MNKDLEEKNIINIKQYICKICLELDKDDLKSILNFLKREHLDNSLFNQNYDGIKINLDLLEDSIIFKLYNYIQFKISTKNLNQI